MRSSPRSGPRTAPAPRPCPAPGPEAELHAPVHEPLLEGPGPGEDQALQAVGLPGLDLSPEGIAGEVVRAYNVGANAVHLHVWDERGQPTLHLDAFQRTLRLIRERCEIVIEGSTGGVNELSPAERERQIDANLQSYRFAANMELISDLVLQG